MTKDQYQKSKFIIIQQHSDFSLGEPTPLQVGKKKELIKNNYWNAWTESYRDYKNVFDSITKQHSIDIPVDIGINNEGDFELKIPEEDELTNIVTQRIGEFDDELSEGKDIYDELPCPPSIYLFYKNPDGPMLHIFKTFLQPEAGARNNIIYNESKNAFNVRAMIIDSTEKQELNIPNLPELNGREFYNIGMQEVIKLIEAFFELNWNFILTEGESLEGFQSPRWPVP